MATQLRYVDTLDKQAKERYLKKLADINGEDPYETSPDKWVADMESLPRVTHPDIVNYCVNTQSTYSLQDFRAYKSLESYNQFVCGWVSNLVSRCVSNKVIVKAKVRHSQSVNKAPLQPWVVAEKDGLVVSAHCNCMAGLGEVCSHIGATLFTIDAAVKLHNSKTVTQEKAYWLPAGIKKVEFKRVSEINFQSAKSMKKHYGSMLTSPTDKKQPATQKLAYVPDPTSEEVAGLLHKLHLTNVKPAVLAVIPDYAHYYVPTVLGTDTPVILSELFNEDCIDLDFESLKDVCKGVVNELSVSQSQSHRVERLTRDQAGCKEWHRFRTGRVTASRMKRVCSTDTSKPSYSLIKEICYPHTVKFKNSATQWGCDHERDALQAYEETMKEAHDGFKLVRSGFRINSDYPFIGASPDGMVECSCCGKGVVEVKCPYCYRDSNITVVADASGTCLSKVDGEVTLKRKHQYFYQIQTQMLVCAVDFCDFVVWTTKSWHQERVEPDLKFIEELCLKSELFFREVIMLEVVGQYFSRQQIGPLHEQPHPNVNTKKSDSSNDHVCICQQPFNSHQKYVQCQSEDCSAKYFHMTCLSLKRMPKGIWYCKSCRKQSGFKCNRSAKK